MIRPVGNGLVMQQLLYADEVRPFSEVPIGDAEVKEAELKLAVQLVDQIATDEFHPENYEDEVRKRYHEAIQRKVEGQEITAAPEAAAGPDHRPHGGAQGQPGREGRRRGPAGGRGSRARRGAASPPARRPSGDRGLDPSAPCADSLARVEPRRRRLRALPAPARAGAARSRATKVKRFRDQEYWGRPVPGFGDPRARLLVVGLAPAAHGGNRTGRVFTGDRSGDFLFAALHRAGFASQPTSVGRGRRPAAARLLHRARRPLRAPRQQADPGGDRPLPRVPRPRVGAPAATCGPSSCSGSIAMEGFLAMLRETGRDVPRGLAFGHGAVHDLGGGVRLFCSFHLSQQNTFTGRLTPRSFDAVLAKVKRHLARG